MFQKRLAEIAGQVDACLTRALAGRTDTDLGAAMRYALAGGKHLRAFLVMETARLHGVPGEGSVGAGAAVEAMHGYSLIHDDLPCMDNDDLRRGQPTVHVKWDEAMAVLAGDALQSLAFELVTSPSCHPDGDVRSQLALGLAQSAGGRGMVLGQAQDIAAETAEQPLTLDQIMTLQANKTGALIGWSAEAGAVLAGADPAPMRKYAVALGLAYQIADDILDVEGDAAIAGKRLGKDAGAGKATFVSHLGLAGARARADDLVSEAEAALAQYGDGADCLRLLARFVISRRK